MNCSEIENPLHAFADGAADAAESLRVAEHLEACASCRKELVELERVKAVLADGAPRPMPAPLRAELETEIERRFAPPWWAPLVRPEARWSLAGALAGGFAAALLGLSLHTPAPRTPTVDLNALLREHAAPAWTASPYEMRRVQDAH